MIPLPQYFLGLSGVVQTPIETDPEACAAEADDFALLMELPAELTNDLAAMLLMPLQMSRPEPVALPLAMDQKPAVVVPVEPEHLIQVVCDPVEITSDDTPQIPVGVVSAEMDVAAPLMQSSEQPDRQPLLAPVLLPASPTPTLRADGIVELSKDQAVTVVRSVNMGKAVVGESAFLIRLEVKAEPLSLVLIHALPSVAETAPQPQAPAATPAETDTTSPTPKMATDQIAKQDQILIGLSQTTAMPEGFTLPQPASVPVAKTALAALEDNLLDVSSPPDPQIIILSGADRAPVASQIVQVPLPASIPATLLTHAPEAALGPVEIVLDPKELGKIRFEIHQQGDQLKVVLAVERPETLDLLRRHADLLIEEFRAAGFAGASLGFSNWGGQRGSTSSQAVVEAQDVQEAEPPTSPGRPKVNRNFGPQQGLNLRL